MFRSRIFRSRAKRKSISRSIAAGAAGGLAASYAMGLFEGAITTLERVYKGPKGEEAESDGQAEDATVKTARAISGHVLHHDLTQPEAKWAGPLVHYAFGTLVGAVYGALAHAAAPVKAGSGTAYGAAVWLAADEMAVPALGLSGSQSPPTMASRAKMLAAHLVYGATTHFTRKLLLIPLGR
jgi:putative membrane protein